METLAEAVERTRKHNQDQGQPDAIRDPATLRLLAALVDQEQPPTLPCAAP